MRDLLDTAVMALLVGALVRTLRELQREKQLRCGDDDEVWPMEKYGEREGRPN